MTTKRVKVVTTAGIKDRSELETAVGNVAALTIDRDKMTNDMQAELKAVRDDYEQDLASCNLQLERELKLVQSWADANGPEFADRKSLVLTHGTIGYRLGQPRLKTLRGFTWDKVLSTVRLVFPQAVRTKIEVDKQVLLGAVQAGEALGPKVGVQIVQDETFFCEPKREETQTV